jgi:hypothetical protein
MGYDLSNLVKIRLETQGVKKSKEMDIEPNPCWDGYEPIGLNPDGSPNCVPIKEEQSKIKKEGFPIPSPSGDEDESKFISRCIGDLTDEYGTEQASAICYAQWEKK